jgi:hypothetical protein
MHVTLLEKPVRHGTKPENDLLVCLSLCEHVLMWSLMDHGKDTGHWLLMQPNYVDASWLFTVTAENVVMRFVRDRSEVIYPAICCAP